MKICQKCGTQFDANFCPSCGAQAGTSPINQQPTYQQQPVYQQPQQFGGMRCPRCGGQNVTVTVEQVGGKTSAKGNGCLWGLGRLTLIVCTCGLWLLVGKHKGTGKTTFKNNTVAICQSCGNKWKV